ncbi:MAG: hypothetical protein AB7I48_18940 [Planctomycetaceae bacterium]
MPPGGAAGGPLREAGWSSADRSRAVIHEFLSQNGDHGGLLSV